MIVAEVLGNFLGTLQTRKRWQRVPLHIGYSRSMTNSGISAESHASHHMTASLCLVVCTTDLWCAAGLRGPMGSGYSRMNHVTVFQASRAC